MDINMGYAGRVLMLGETTFPEDPRIRREAYTLIENNYKVIFIGLKPYGAKTRENVNGVDLYRIPTITVFEKTKGKGISNKIIYTLKVLIGYLIEYTYFTVSAFIISFYVFCKDGFDIIHAHNPPDTLFIIGAFYKLFGKKFVFDHHDLSPELYLSRFDVQDGIIYRTLALLEKMTCRTANIIIATNESYKKINMERSKVKAKDIFVVRNGPDLKKIRPTSPHHNFRGMNKKLLFYVGNMNPQDGLDYLLRAIKHLLYDLKNQKQGVSVLGLQQMLGLGSYRAAWSWLHKLRCAMVRPGRDRLSGIVEVDEAYIGGPEPGKRGRCAAGKTLVVIEA